MSLSGWCQSAPGAVVPLAAHTICQVRVSGGWVTCDCPCHDKQEDQCHT